MAQYTSNDGKLLLDILYRINQTEDIVSFGKTALFFIRTYRNFSSGMFFSLKALNNDVIIDTAVFDDDKPPSRFDQFLNGRYDNDKLLKAMTEAEAYHGPSLIIAYAPCINHGIKGGMGLSQMTEKQAVESGYWHLWRYNPTLPEQGKNPFILDSKEPDWSKFQEFIHKEVRYTSLLKTFPKEAEELFAASESDAKWRYDTYKRYVAMDYSNEKKE